MRSLVTTNGNLVTQEPRSVAPARELAWAPERLIDRLLGNPWESDDSSHQAAGGAPLEILDLDDTIRVAIEVPGIDPDALDISLRGQILTIVGNKEPDSDTVRPGYTERRFGKLQRSVKLPVSVDADSVTAEHKHGVVTITFQKSESIRPKRIEIRPA